MDQGFIKVGETVSLDVIVAKNGARSAALEARTLPGARAEPLDVEGIC